MIFSCFILELKMIVGYVNFNVTIYSKKGINDRLFKKQYKLWNYNADFGKKCIDQL